MKKNLKEKNKKIFKFFLSEKIYFKMSENSIIQDFIKNFKGGTPLGSGTYGEVYQTNNPNIIIKTIKQPKDHKRYFPTIDMIKEIAILSKLKGEFNNIQILDFYYDIANEVLYIAMEKGDFNGTKMIYYMSANPEYRKNVINTFEIFFRDLALGVEQLHRNNIIHRDIKPQNFVQVTTEKGPVLKWIDYGLSYPNSCPYIEADPEMFTIQYRPPELMFSDKEIIYDFAVDIWALAATLYEIYNDGMPLIFEADKITGYKIDEPEQNSLNYTINNLKTLANEKLDNQPVYKGLINHYLADIQEEIKNEKSKDSFFKNGLRKFLKNKDIVLSKIKDVKLRNLLSKMLMEKPADRPTIYQVLTDDYFISNGIIFNGRKLTCFDKLLINSIELPTFGPYYEKKIDPKNDITYQHIINICNKVTDSEEYNKLVVESAWILYHLVKREQSKYEYVKPETNKMIAWGCVLIYIKLYNIKNDDFLNHYIEFQTYIMTLMKGNIIFSIPYLFSKLRLTAQIKDYLRRLDSGGKFVNAPLKSIILRYFSREAKLYSNFSEEELIDFIIEEVKIQE